MLNLDFHNDRGPMTVLTVITALNFGLIISFLTANIGVTGFVLNGIQIYILVSLELVGVIVAYEISKRRNTTVPL